MVLGNKMLMICERAYCCDVVRLGIKCPHFIPHKSEEINSPRKCDEEGDCLNHFRPSRIKCLPYDMLTEKEISVHISDDEMRCPRCKYDTVKFIPNYINLLNYVTHTKLWKEMFCENCGLKWTDEFTLTNAFMTKHQIKEIPL